MRTFAAVGDNCMDVYDNLGTRSPGGNAVNVAVYLTRLGEKAAYVGVVGRDEVGDALLGAVSARGVDISHVQRAEGHTAVTRIELVDGERVMGAYDEGVMADFTLSEDDVAFLGAHRYVISVIWGHAQAYFAGIRALGAKIAFDASTAPFSPRAQAALGDTDYFFFSAQEDTSELRAGMERLHAGGPELVIATLGSRGSLAFDGREFYAFGTLPCAVVDTLGAGDSYIAGFMAGVARGADVADCMRLGATCAAETIGYRGAW